MLNRHFEEILACVPEKPPRSRLEPYRELIEELRRRRVTFREITEILKEKCGVSVTRAGIHDFLKTRGAARDATPNRQPRCPVRPVATSEIGSVKAAQLKQHANSAKTQQPRIDSEATDFTYDPAEPLQLGNRSKRNSR